jgi:RNA polymerase sigma-70 factor (ECF subfamily)
METVSREPGAAMARLESPDELLVVAAIFGNLEAFEELVLRYRPAVVRLARTIVGTSLAEDVAQESLLLAFKALPTIEEPTRFAAWLSAITRHRASRFNKKENAHLAKRVALDEALLERIDALVTPLAEKAENEEMIKILDSLPVDYALPLRLRFLDEMPLKRIAAFMGIPVSTVKWRVHHGKKLLRSKLNPEGRDDDKRSVRLPQ